MGEDIVPGSQLTRQQTLKLYDADGDGNIDFWMYLDESGRVVKTGRDIDGDGVMDVRQD